MDSLEVFLTLLLREPLLDGIKAGAPFFPDIVAILIKIG